VGIFSCAESFAPDFYGCSEFYTQAAADMIRDTCVALGDSTDNTPCAPQFDVCCLKQDGSNHLPEKRCLAVATLSDAATFDALCEQHGDEVCPR
jgi:hypothetical protein